jgi:hypothetical protein
VHHQEGNYVYPVVAGVGWEGGFQTYEGTVSEGEEGEPSNSAVEGEPTLEVHVSAPVYAPTNDPGVDAKLSSTSSRYLKTWGTSICAPLGQCGVWKTRFKGFFITTTGKPGIPAIGIPIAFRPIVGTTILKSLSALGLDLMINPMKMAITSRRELSLRLRRTIRIQFQM